MMRHLHCVGSQVRRRVVERWFEALEPRVMLSAADPLLFWNQVAIDTVLVDSQAAAPQQGGPTNASRAMAIVHLAMYDAYCGVTGQFDPLMSHRKAPKGDAEAAIASAARYTLVELFSDQEQAIDQAYEQALDNIDASKKAMKQGLKQGKKVAAFVLKHRNKDGWNKLAEYQPSGEPGYHDVDPLNPQQGFHGPGWGNVTPFMDGSTTQYVPPPFPELDSDEYAQMYEEVYIKGAADAQTADRNQDGQPDRTADETDIGIFWAYDSRLGTPVRIFNLAARQVAQDQANTLAENVQLFAMLNLAMGDAGINAWAAKYTYDVWRPILAIRQGDLDGNDATVGDPNWVPLGAPYNDPAHPDATFTPPFPAYTSGHSTFGAAAFEILRQFYGTDNISFDLTSEDSGTTRHFDSFTQAQQENGQSRIYLGVHWQADNVHGQLAGEAIAQVIYDKMVHG